MTTSSSTQSEPATVLAGKYQLEEILGSGAMGTVYRARHLVLGSPVAVKLMHRSGDPFLTQRFLREARLAAAVRHPNVVSILDFGTTDDAQPFMVMAFLEGRPLNEYIESPDQPARPGLSLDEQVGVVVQLLAGLDAVHRAGIVHRDLKPANIIVSHLADGSYFARLLDFGISFSVDPESALRRGRYGTDAQMIIGTPEYMSYEQAQGQLDVDSRTDVYAAGVILYEMLSGGQLPYADIHPGAILFKIMDGSHVPLEQLRPDIPDLCAVVERALCSDRGQRFQSAGDLRRALLKAMGKTETGETPSLLPIDRGISERPTRASADLLRGLQPLSSGGAPSLPYLPPEQSRWRMVLGATLVGLLLVAVVLGLWRATMTDGETLATEGETLAAPVASTEPSARPVAPPTIASTPAAGSDPTSAAAPADGETAPAPEARRTSPISSPSASPRRGARSTGRRGLRPGLIVRDLDF